jgi:hypothetical protein
MTTRIITPSGAGHRALFPSAKNGRGIRCQSLLELDACRFLEFCPDVRSYEEQVEVEVSLGPGTRRIIRPDFHVVAHGRPLIVVEVKPKARLCEERICARIAVLRRQFERLGVPYRVLTEVELRQQPLQQNLCRLMTFRSFRPLPVLASIRAQLPIRPVPLGEVVERLADYQLAMRLLADGVLFTNLHAPMSVTSLVSINSEEFSDEEFRL